MELVSVHLPVRYFHRPKKGRVQPCLGAIPASLRTVTSKEAPVAVTLDLPIKFAYQGRMEGQFRLFDGRLWSQWGTERTSWTESLERIAPAVARSDPHYWSECIERVSSDAARSDPHYASKISKDTLNWTLAINHPFRSWFHCAGGNGGSVLDTVVVEEPEHPEFHEAAAIVRRNAEQALFVDGNLWVPSIGPKLMLYRDREGKNSHFQYDHGEEGVAGGYAPGRHLTFDGTDSQAALKLVAPYLGDIPIKGEPPTVILAEGWSASQDILFHAGEALAWNMLFHAGHKPITERSPAHVAAYLDLREAMADRWKDTQVNLNPAKSYKMGVDLGYGVPPDPTPLFPFFEAMVQSADQHCPAPVVRDWQIAIDHLRTLEPVEILSGLRL